MPPLTELPLNRFCNFVWWFLTRNAESTQDVEKLRARLYRPPPGQVATVGPWTPAAEMAAFDSLKRGLAAK